MDECPSMAIARSINAAEIKIKLNMLKTIDKPNNALLDPDLTTDK